MNSMRSRQFDERDLILVVRAAGQVWQDAWGTPGISDGHRGGPVEISGNERLGPWWPGLLLAKDR